MQYPTERGRLLVCILVLLIPTFLLLSCSSDDSTTPEPEPVQADVNEYMATLPAWSEVSPPMADDVSNLTDTAEDLDFTDTGPYLCQTTHCSITDTPEEIVTLGVAENVLWLGALIQGHTYLGGIGTMEALPISQRAPLTITINIPSGDSQRTVTDPDVGSVGDAIGELIDSATAAGYDGAGHVFYEMETFHSMDQAMLALDLSAKFVGGSIRGSLEVSTETEKNSIIAYFKQIMFKTSVELPQTPSEFFSNEFTAEVLEDQIELGRIGPESLPVFVSEISWGRMMVMTMTSTHSAKEMKAALEAKKAAMGGGSLSTEMKAVLDASTMKVVALGGSNDTVLGLLQNGDLGQFFAESPPLGTAVKLGYSLCNLADNKVALVSETTEYDRVECSAVDVQYYNSEPQFQAAIEGMGGTVHAFPTNEASMAHAIGVEPADNAPLGRILYFMSHDTGLPLNFSLEARYEYLGNDGDRSLVWEDEEGSDFPSWQDNTISIGDIGNQENDDFYLGAAYTQGYGHICGLGIYVTDNEGDNENESLTVYGGQAGDRALATFLSSNAELGWPDIDNGSAFMGVVSTVPIYRFLFNEDEFGDDIFVKDFFFGTKEDPVEEEDE